jgi:hypothetical protein
MILFEGSPQSLIFGPRRGVAAPVLLSISPAFGSTAGDTVPHVLTGTGFTGVAASGAVTVGGAAATYTVDSDTQITITAMPALATGDAYDVAVTRGGQTGTLAGAYSAGPFVALQLAGLGYTLNGSTIETWADRSGNTNDAAQTSAASQPTPRDGNHARAIGGRPVVDFISSDFFSLPSLAALTAGEGFIVAKKDHDPASSGADIALWTLGTGGAIVGFPWFDGVIYDDFGSTVRRGTANPTPSLTSPFLYNATSVAGEWTNRVNGTQIFTTATNTVSFASSPLLGASNSSTFCQGVIGFFGLLSAKASTTLRSRVNAWVASYYGISVA